MIFNEEQVKQFLPHRDPFLFVDSVESIECPHEDPKSAKDLVGSSVVAHYRTKKEHEIFKGHFPGNPIFPGVCQVEMMAQGACFIVSKMADDPCNCDLEVALMGIESAKFRRPILPEMDLVITATCTKARGVVMYYECAVAHEGKPVAQCTVMASAKV
jgi:3-hydroxyacyl-[acyl-carrier-protein] dehydratase